jgi:hypothetical protein
MLLIIEIGLALRASWGLGRTDCVAMLLWKRLSGSCSAAGRNSPEATFSQEQWSI